MGIRISSRPGFILYRCEGWDDLVSKECGALQYNFFGLNPRRHSFFLVDARKGRTIRTNKSLTCLRLNILSPYRHPSVI